MSDKTKSGPAAKMIARRNAAFIVALAALAGGCLMERVSLALIVPSIIVLGLLCTPYLIPLRGAKSD